MKIIQDITMKELMMQLMNISKLQKNIKYLYHNSLSSICEFKRFRNKQHYWSNNYGTIKENIDSIDITLEENILNEINLIHEKIPNPAP